MDGQIDISIDSWMNARTDGLTDQPMETVVDKDNQWRRWLVKTNFI